MEMTFKQKVENFWYYNKWFVIVGGIFAIFFIIAFVQIITKVESDVDIMYVGPSQVASANVEDMQENISAVVKRDFNDDGEIFVKIISYKVYTGESNGEFDAFQKGEIEGYTTELIAGDSTILLLDPVIYEGLKKDGIIMPLTEVLGFEPTVANDGYSFKLSELPLYKKPGFSALPKDTVLCVKYTRSFALLDKESAEAKHSFNLDVFRWLYESFSE